MYIICSLYDGTISEIQVDSTLATLYGILLFFLEVCNAVCYIIIIHMHAGHVIVHGWDLTK